MRINTKVFGEIEIIEEKIIHFPSGIIGFPGLTDFALVHDEEKGIGAIHWLQSIQEPGFAMPVMDPLLVKPDYNPEVDDELLKPIGDLEPEELLVLLELPEEMRLPPSSLEGDSAGSPPQAATARVRATASTRQTRVRREE